MRKVLRRAKTESFSQHFQTFVYDDDVSANFFPISIKFAFQMDRLNSTRWIPVIFNHLYGNIRGKAVTLNERKKKSTMIEERKMRHSHDEIKQSFWWSTPLHYGSRLHIIREKHSYWLDYFMKSRNRILIANKLKFRLTLLHQSVGYVFFLFMTFIPDFLYLCVVQLYVAIHYRYWAN